ncbi:HNH endonuclease [Geodermatophilus sp. CPCC 205506]|uniref:HNH endonuclease n=1 Tax=Geodermatophilus sp. CPCC 205506 TaxID=2936596 RepID=UPI003EE8844C
MEFYRVEPTAVTSWRMAVLMGANSRTYKFALGSALLDLARRGCEEASLTELAVPYAMQLVQRAGRYPQAPAGSVSSAADFLTVLHEESSTSLRHGAPTSRLLDAAVASMPQMVMKKFHNLRGVGEVGHRFYELRGLGSSRRLSLTPQMLAVARHEALLRLELDARWSIVEACFDAELGRGLLGSGVVVSADGERLLTPARRVALAGAREALIGFQHGRCFYCAEPITLDVAAVHVDHVYPFALMQSGVWEGPDLNGVWNLVVACPPCNLRKSSRRLVPAK